MMTMEIPSLARVPSIKSLFEAVAGQHRRFSFLTASSASRSSGHVSISTPVEREDGIPMAVEVESPMSGEEAEAAAIQVVLKFLCERMVDDIPEEKSCFIGLAVPPITLKDYVERLVRYTNQWAEDRSSQLSTGMRCLLIAIEYLLRANVRLTPRSVHRYVMTAMLVAAKYTEDFSISNQFWGDVGGCKLEDVNRMEIAFAILMNWSFRISEKSCDAYIRRYSDVPSYS